MAAVVPFLSLREQTGALREEVMAAIAEVVDAQAFAGGRFVELFEADFAKYLSVGNVVCVNSGTTSLQAALLCAGVSPGDDVLTVAHTWISTAWAISYVGARPVFCDIDPATCGMDPADLVKKLTPKTKAILPVHLYGLPVRLEEIASFARAKGLPMIEDAAQSIGATIDGRQTGTAGLVNATSFYPGKNLGAFGEGGAIMTNDTSIAERVRSLRDHAQRGRHHHVEIGFNWRMDGIQAAVLRVKLKHLDRWNARRREIAAAYFAGLRGAKVKLLQPLAGTTPNWHIFPVFHAQRDELRLRLEARGIQTGVHYPTPVHLQPAYASLGLAKGALPHSEELAATEVSLPMFAELTDEEVARSIAAVREVAEELG